MKESGINGVTLVEHPSYIENTPTQVWEVPNSPFKLLENEGNITHLVYERVPEATDFTTDLTSAAAVILAAASFIR